MLLEGPFIRIILITLNEKAFVGQILISESSFVQKVGNVGNCLIFVLKWKHNLLDDDV